MQAQDKLLGRFAQAFAECRDRSEPEGKRKRPLQCFEQRDQSNAPVAARRQESLGHAKRSVLASSPESPFEGGYFPPV
jgi:hypothetical protein